MKKYLCRCGNMVDEIKSYFNKENVRITVCDTCANKYGLNDVDKYDIVKHDELTATQKEKPIPNAEH